MLLESSSYILSNACVQCAIPAAKNVDIPDLGIGGASAHSRVLSLQLVLDSWFSQSDVLRLPFLDIVDLPGLFKVVPPLVYTPV